MAPTPLFHVTANNCLLHPATISGSRIVFTYKWDAGRALELVEREGVTNFSGVPTMSREMLMHPDWEKRNTSTLAGMGGGGAPLQPDLVEKMKEGYEVVNNRLAITGAIRKVFATKPEKFDPRDYIKPARAAMKEVVKDRMIALGQAGHGDKIPHVTLEDMGRRYHDMKV